MADMEVAFDNAYSVKYASNVGFELWSASENEQCNREDHVT